MLSRRYRLTGRLNYLRVQEKGKVFQSKNFGVAIFDRRDMDPTRVGFIVSTKIAKDSADRGLAKRKMSEGVRTSMIDVRPGFDVAFLAKKTITRIPTDEIIREVKLALKNSGLMK